MKSNSGGQRNPTSDFVSTTTKSLSSSGSDCDTENETSYEGGSTGSSDRSPSPELQCAVEGNDNPVVEEYVPVGVSSAVSDIYYPAANTLKLRSNSYRGAPVSSMEYCSADSTRKSIVKYCNIRKPAISKSDAEDYTHVTASRSRIKPAEEYDSVFDSTLPKQEYTSTVVTPKFVDMFSSLKKVDLETRIPLTQNEAMYAKRTIELRGTVTAVAEQLSASRQMEKKLKLRLEDAYNDIEELENDKYKLKQDLRDAVIDLDMAEERIKERDDIIVEKDMELFVLRNNMELLRRSQLKAEEEKAELVAMFDAQNQAYDKMSTSSWKKTHVPKTRQANSVGREFPNDPYRYHYFAPNYKLNKMKPAVSGTNGNDQLSSTLESTSNSLKNESSQTQSSLTEQALERTTTSMNPNVDETSSITTETDMDTTASSLDMEPIFYDLNAETEPSDVMECGIEDSSPNSRPESPVELEIRADYDDDFNLPNTPCKKVVRHASI